MPCFEQVYNYYAAQRNSGSTGIYVYTGICNNTIAATTTTVVVESKKRRE